MTSHMWITFTSCLYLKLSTALQYWFHKRDNDHDFMGCVFYHQRNLIDSFGFIFITAIIYIDSKIHNICRGFSPTLLTESINSEIHITFTTCTCIMFDVCYCSKCGNSGWKIRTNIYITLNNPVMILKATKDIYMETCKG